MNTCISGLPKKRLKKRDATELAADPPQSAELGHPSKNEPRMPGIVVPFIISISILRININISMSISIIFSINISISMTISINILVLILELVSILILILVLFLILLVLVLNLKIHARPLKNLFCCLMSLAVPPDSQEEAD